MSIDFCATCRMWTYRNTDGCTECWRRAGLLNAEAAKLAETARRRQWYVDHAHCGACGSPGNYCQCRVPCPCSDLHEVGSGLSADPAVLFAESVNVDQMGLFDE
jgi:hypothetical protein